MQSRVCKASAELSGMGPEYSSWYTIDGWRYPNNELFGMKTQVCPVNRYIKRCINTPRLIYTTTRSELNCIFSENWCWNLVRSFTRAFLPDSSLCLWRSRRNVKIRSVFISGDRSVSVAEQPSRSNCSVLLPLKHVTRSNQ